MTGVVLFVMALVVLSYREVVTVYTRAGGSYVVARDNFGPRVAQIAAVALLIDYVVTVAVQVAAGTAAVASAVPRLEHPDADHADLDRIVILMCYGNLRGIREAGRAFAVPTYLFSGVVIIMIIVGPGPGDARRPAGSAPCARYRASTARAGTTTAALIAFATDLRAAAGVRQRRLVADRHRGRLQRGERVPAAGGHQRPQGAGHRGPDPRHAGGRDLLAGPRHARDALRRPGCRRSSRRRPSSSSAQSGSAQRCSSSSRPPPR